MSKYSNQKIEIGQINKTYNSTTCWLHIVVISNLMTWVESKRDEMIGMQKINNNRKAGVAILISDK